MEKTKHSSADRRDQKEIQPRGSTVTVEKAAHRKEIEEILKNAAKPAEAQAVLGLAGQHAGILPKELAILSAVDDIQDPDLAYRIYYKILGGLRRIYILHNPLIDIPQAARSEINKEIRIYLKEGRKHADSRMAKTKRMEKAVKLIVEWTNECKVDDIAELYRRFCEANDAVPRGKK